MVNVQWSMFNVLSGESMIYSVLLISAIAQSCPAQPIVTDTTKVLNWQATCWCCLMVTENWCSGYLNDNRGCRRLSRSATRTWHRRWHRQQNAWRTAKRSTLPNALQKLCKRQLAKRAASHGNRLRRAKRQTPPP